MLAAILLPWSVKTARDTVDRTLPGGKAGGVLAMGVSSRKLGEMAADRPQFVAALAVAYAGKLIPAAGGVLIEDTSGTLLGAIGVSGDLSNKDEQVAFAGIEAAGLVAG